MPKLKDAPRVKDVLVARALLEGKSQSKAALEGGYSASTAYKAASKICGSPQVIAALREIGRTVHIEHLDELANARLQGLLASPDVDPKVLISAIRVQKEMAGQVGSGKERTHSHEVRFSKETMDFIRANRAEVQQQAFNRSLPDLTETIIAAEPKE